MGRIVDGYTNIGTLKLFAHARQEENYARQALAEQTEKQQLSTRVITAMDVSINTLNGVLIVGTAGLALWLWSQDSITLGAITLALGLVIRINNMSAWIMWEVSGIFENVGIVQDALSTISQPKQVLDAPAARPLAIARGEVRFDDVSFHYGGAREVIPHLDLTVRAGEKIGLIGPSGAGKSTLVNVLLRLYDLQGGRILIDGQDIAGVTQESLRSQIGVVTQDTSLLHRSIRDNLLYGRPDASEQQLQDAVRRARAGDFIAGLIDGEGRRGLDAHVGERGVKLSGGQRQRIAIARVLPQGRSHPDPGRSHLGAGLEVESAIQESLETLMQGKTVIAIAHRLSTIARMDRLVVLDQGRIVEAGTHAELVARGGLYARLWSHQTGGFVGLIERAPASADAGGSDGRHPCRQRLAIHLAHRVLGQRVHPEHVARHIDAAQARQHGGADPRLVRRRRAGRAGREHHRNFAQVGIGRAHHAAGRHAGQRRHHALHQRWRDVLAATDDHVLDAPGDGQIAVGVEAAHVAGAQPPVRHAGLALRAQVAQHQAVALDADLALAASWRRAAVGLAQDHALAGQHRAHRAHAPRAGRIHGRGAGRLRQAVGHQQRAAQESLDAPVQRPVIGAEPQRA